MKKFFLLMTGLIMVTGLALAQQRITVASGDWAPYQGDTLPGGGPAGVIVAEAFASQGWEVTFEYLPWARGFTLAQQARNDGTFLYGYSDERAENFLYSDPIINLDTVIFYRKDRPIEWSAPGDLKRYTLGAVLEYNYGFIRESDGFTLDRIADPVSNFRKLAAGRVDGVLEEVMVGWDLAERAGVADRVAYHPRAVDSEPFHFIVSRSHPDAERIIATFNAGLSALRASGRLDEVLARN
ncbi:substrate-binding periplasmic protein [Alkalispirochaeta alkalica]|nr:transporter substrate-binding domain-containing protein [Alkalispirochaeta alkalica]